MRDSLFCEISSNLAVFSFVIEKIIIFYTDLMENVYLYKIRKFFEASESDVSNERLHHMRIVRNTNLNNN